MRLYRLVNLKDLMWFAVLAGLFCSFTYWIFNLLGMAVILVVFSAIVGWKVWSSANDLTNWCRKNGGLHLATEDEYPDLMQAVWLCCSAADLPVPPVYVWDNPEPNAFATGRSPNKSVIVVYRGLLDNATPAEIKGIISHEVGHINNRDALNKSICSIFCVALEFQAKTFTLVGTFLLGLLVVKESSRRSRQKRKSHTLRVSLILSLGISMLVLGLIAHVIAYISHLILFNLSRTRELRADVTGARISGDPNALADALVRIELVAMSVRQEVPPPPITIRQLSIVNPLVGMPVDASFLGKFLSRISMSLENTHPKMEERIRRLRALDIKELPGPEGQIS